MNALKPGHSDKQIPRGVAYNSGRPNGVLGSAPVCKKVCLRLCVCVGLCFIYCELTQHCDPSQLF